MEGQNETQEGCVGGGGEHLGRRRGKESGSKGQWAGGVLPLLTPVGVEGEAESNPRGDGVRKQGLWEAIRS